MCAGDKPTKEVGRIEAINCCVNERLHSYCHYLELADAVDHLRMRLLHLVECCLQPLAVRFQSLLALLQLRLTAGSVHIARTDKRSAKSSRAWLGALRGCH